MKTTVQAAKAAKAAQAAMAAVDPEVQVFLRHLAAGGGGPIERLPPVKARRALAGLQSEVKPSPAFMRGARVQEKTVRLVVPGGTSDVRLTIVRERTSGPPETLLAPAPAFMFFHGGGWVLGDFPTHERMVRDLVAASRGAVAVFVNYTPSPEAGYGVAVEQAYAATKWVAENGASIGVDGRRLAVAGNSVGGNMATVVALMALHRGGPDLRAQVLFWPVVDTNFDRPSYKRFADGFFLTRGMMKWFWDNYTTDKGQRREICACPIRAKADELRGLPPTLIQTAESDVLRDEGEAYGRNLSAAGVEVTSVRYNGMIHDFTLLNGISTVPAVRSAIEQAGQFLARRLT